MTSCLYDLSIILFLDSTNQPDEESDDCEAEKKVCIKEEENSSQEKFCKEKEDEEGKDVFEKSLEEEIGT